MPGTATKPEHMLCSVTEISVSAQQIHIERSHRLVGLSHCGIHTENQNVPTLA